MSVTQLARLLSYMGTVDVHEAVARSFATFRIIFKENIRELYLTTGAELQSKSVISLVIQRTSNKNSGLLLFLQDTNFAADSISRSQNQPPHFPQLRVVHRDVTFKAIHTQ